MGKNPIFRVFWVFWAPWTLPGTPVPRGFYINPSRRGPAPARGPGGEETPHRGREGQPLPSFRGRLVHPWVAVGGRLRLVKEVPRRHWSIQPNRSSLTN